MNQTSSQKGKGIRSIGHEGTGAWAKRETGVRLHTDRVCLEGDRRQSQNYYKKKTTIGKKKECSQRTNLGYTDGPSYLDKIEGLGISAREKGGERYKPIGGVRKRRRGVEEKDRFLNGKGEKKIRPCPHVNFKKSALHVRDKKFRSIRGPKSTRDSKYKTRGNRSR